MLITLGSVSGVQFDLLQQLTTLSIKNLYCYLRTKCFSSKSCLHMSNPINTLIFAGNWTQLSPRFIPTDWLKGVCVYSQLLLRNTFVLFHSFPLHILSTDVQDKSRCRDIRVYIKSCNIVRYKEGHVSFVCLHMKSVQTRTIVDFAWNDTLWSGV